MFLHSPFPFSGPGCNIDNMPEIMNGRKIEVPGTRGSVFKYRCNAPFKLFGHHGPIGCQGNNKWSLQHIPVCTSKYWLYEEIIKKKK